MTFSPNTLYATTSGGYIYTTFVNNHAVHYTPIGCSGIVAAPPHVFSVNSSLAVNFTKAAECVSIPNLSTITVDDLYTYYPELFL